MGGWDSKLLVSYAARHRFEPPPPPAGLRDVRLMPETRQSLPRLDSLLLFETNIHTTNQGGISPLKTLPHLAK